MTLDIFCGNEVCFRRVAGEVDAERVARLFHADSGSVRRFEIPELSVLKFSLPRPVVQGDRLDRDMHGASWAALLAELDIIATD